MRRGVAISGAVHALTFDVEAWFHAANLAIPRKQWDELPLRLAEPIDAILTMLNETRQRATFFVLGWVGRRAPDLIHRIHREGHEIASHGFEHTPITEMTRDEFAQDLRRAADVLESITLAPVRGYRAPSYSIPADDHWALTELAEQGYAYDSSIYPTRAPHGRYGQNHGRLEPYEVRPTLMEYPLPVLSMVGKRIPAATGGYFRLFPPHVTRWVLRQYARRQQDGRTAPAVVNIHPWELDPDQPRVGGAAHTRWRHYVNLRRTRRRLRMLLHRYRFAPLGDFVPSSTPTTTTDASGNRSHDVAPRMSTAVSVQ